jgi:bacteriorhodopsin
MKFVVGIMLTAFGTFWGAEGAGVSWPGNDAALLVLVPVIALVSFGYTILLGRGRVGRPGFLAGTHEAPAAAAPQTASEQAVPEPATSEPATSEEAAR